MIASWLPLAPLVVLLILAAGWDVASFTIPNFIQVASASWLCSYSLSCRVFRLSAIGWHLLAGGAGLAAGFTLFALGYIGGGDAKLFACVALWLGFRDLPAYALIACVLGGGFRLAFLRSENFRCLHFLPASEWLLRLHDRQVRACLMAWLWLRDFSSFFRRRKFFISWQPTSDNFTAPY